MGIQGTGMPVQVALDRAAMERMDLARGAGHHFRGIDPVVRKIAYVAKNSRIPSVSSNGQTVHVGTSLHSFGNRRRLSDPGQQFTCRDYRADFCTGPFN